MPRWDNEHRRRFVYLLGFEGRRVYVGQTSDAKRRVRQHLDHWRQPFVPVIVERFMGLERDAVFREYAWRWAAHRHGWAVLTLAGIDFAALPGLVREDCRVFGESRQWPFIT